MNTPLTQNFGSLVIDVASCSPRVPHIIVTCLVEPETAPVGLMGQVSWGSFYGAACPTVLEKGPAGVAKLPHKTPTGTCGMGQLLPQTPPPFCGPCGAELLFLACHPERRHSREIKTVGLSPNARPGVVNVRSGVRQALYSVSNMHCFWIVLPWLAVRFFC